jgi:uroporphyrinogen decarboxylase
MTKLSGLERINKVLNLEEPDTVPHTELLIEQNIIDAIHPGDSYDDFVEYMDLDGILVFDKLSAWKFDTVDEEKKIKRDQWGGLIRFSEVAALGISVGTAFKTDNDVDLDSYIPPDPDEEWRYDRLREVVKRYKGERAIIAQVYDGFNILHESILTHFEFFSAMINNPDIVDQLTDIVGNYNLRYIKNCIEVGADVIFVSGDYAMTHGPMVSREHTARFLTPMLKKMVDTAHSLNKPLMKHSDGNIDKIIDLIVETGIDGLHPIDVIAGMDIAKVKAEYGDKVCIMGNVNVGPTLCSGTVREVRQEVKDCIKKAGIGGGYICSSSNIIHSGVKPENYVAMVKAIKDYGKYPLELD